MTASVKLWVALGRVPFCAVMVMGYEPARVAVPETVAVPLPLSMKVTPVGSAPLSFNAGVGEPLVVTVNAPAAPAVNVALLALVIAGGPTTVSVKLCVAFGLVPLAAVMVSG